MNLSSGDKAHIFFDRSSSTESGVLTGVSPYYLQYVTGSRGNWTNPEYIKDSFKNDVKGRYASVAVDALDALHIAYYDDENGDLKYIYSQGEATSNKANLTPFKPSGWSDKIVVSKTKGTYADSSPLYTTDKLWVDWAAINNGSAAISKQFSTKLYVDGHLKKTWKTDSLKVAYYCHVSDVSIGSLGKGKHTLKVTTRPYQSRSVQKRPFGWRPGDCIPYLPWSADNWRYGNKHGHTFLF